MSESVIENLSPAPVSARRLSPALGLYYNYGILPV